MGPMKEKSSTTDDFETVIKGLRDPNSSVRVACLLELRKMGEGGAAAAGTAEKAVELIDDEEMEVQSAAIHAIGAMGQIGASYADRIIDKLKSRDGNVLQAAIQALGLLGPRVAKCAETIETFLEDSNPEVVGDACVALGGMKVTSCSKKLVQKLKGDDKDVVVSALSGLARMDVEVEAFGEMLSHKNVVVRTTAMNSLAIMTNIESLAPAVAKCIADPDGMVRIAAVNLISLMGEKAAGQVKVIVPMLKHQDAGVRALSAMALSALKSGAEAEVVEQLDAIEALLADAEEDTSMLMLARAGVQPKVAPELRKPGCAAATLIGVLGLKAQGSAGKVAAGLSSPDYEMRVLCAKALGQLGADQFETELADLLEDPVPVVVAAACSGLGTLAEVTCMGSASAAERMAECLADKAPIVRAAAAEALGKMGEEAFDHLDVLAKKIEDPIWTVRAAAIEAIARCGERGQMYAADICRHIFDQDYQVRVTALTALSGFGERGAAFAEEVASLLQDTFPDIRVEALKVLAIFGPEAAGGYKNEVEKILQTDKLDRVKNEAQNTLDAFTAFAGISDGNGE